MLPRRHGVPVATMPRIIMRVQDLDYDLPPELIATQPADPRDSARLMVVHRDSGKVEHRRVRDLPSLGVFQPGDLMVVNQTRVLPARFEATRAKTNGKVRGLYVASPDAKHWHVMLEARGQLTIDETITLDDRAHLTLVEPLGGGEWLARFNGDADVLHRLGATPLPPYIQKARKQAGQPEVTAADAERYNTIYAQQPGSVAAPTAGLHFTPDLLRSLEQAGVRRAAVTLHVGLGTFAPIRVENVDDHPIHHEWIDIPPTTIAALSEARTVTPIGTTTVRTLESLPPRQETTTAPPPNDYTAQTNLYITPGAVERGFRFRFTDHLMTNFHLPRSTLLAMVAAMPDVGLDRLLDWYRLAISERYRFYSYGDAMLIV